MRQLRTTAFYAAISTAGCFLSSVAYAQAVGKCESSYSTPFHVLLRSDFSDLGPLSCTHSQLTAQGATFSFADNLLTNQKSAAVDGLLAFEFTKFNPVATFLQAFAIGAYVQGDDTYQFQPNSKQLYNGTTVTTGGFAEVMLINRAFGWDDFRIRDGEATVNTGTRSNTLVAEWIPTYRLGRQIQLAIPTQLGTAPIMYTFTPELMVQYDRFDGGPKTAQLFATRNEALRIGPQFQLILTPNGDLKNFVCDPIWLNILQKVSLILTNHESWDEYSGKAYNWSAVALNYTFPPWLSFPNAPSFGLSASFGVGNLEGSGNYAKQVKLGLAAKL